MIIHVQFQMAQTKLDKDLNVTLRQSVFFLINLSGAHEPITGLSGVRVAQSLVFFVVLCTSLHVCSSEPSVFYFDHCIVCNCF